MRTDRPAPPPPRPADEPPEALVRLFDLAAGQLRAACPECADALARLDGDEEELRWTSPERFRREPADTPTPDPAAEAAAAEAAQRDLKSLTGLDAADRVDAVRRARAGMSGTALVEALFARAREVVGNDPGAALGWLDCAGAVLARTSFARPEPQERLLLRFHAYRANALRVQGELPAADELWPVIHDLLRRRPLGSPGAEGEIWAMEASLRRAQRRFPEALRLLDRAERLFRTAGDLTGVAKVLNNRGTTLDYAGDPKAAVPIYCAAIDHFDPVHEPNAFWETHRNLANCLVDAGRPAEAAEVLSTAEPYFRREADAGSRRRRSWVEAKIARAMGRHTEAETKLRTVIADCAPLRLAYDAALAGLDLAAVYLESGRPKKACKLAAATAPCLRSRQVHAEAQKALRLVHRAAAAGTLTAEGLAETRRYLELARDDPRFVFVPRALAEPGA